MDDGLVERMKQVWEEFQGPNAGYVLELFERFLQDPQSVDPALPLTEEDFGRREKAVAARYAEARPLIVHFPPDEYNGGCQAAGRGFIHINADGYVEPCPFSHFARDNVLEKPLPEILASPFLTEIRELVKTLENPHRECLLFKHSGRVSEVARRHGGFSTERLPGPSAIQAPRLLSAVS